MDDNLLVVQGSIGAMNEALQSLQYRAVYKLNDSMTITLVDGEYNVTERIALLYQKEEKQLSSQFKLIVLVAAVLISVSLLSCLVNCVSKCKKPKKSKRLPLTKEKQTNVAHSPPKKKTPPPPPTSLPPVNKTIREKDTIEEISKKSIKPPSVQC